MNATAVCERSTLVKDLPEAMAELGALKPTPTLPVLFVGHGNPMNAITENSFAQEWRRIGRNLPEPAVVVCISAHWMTQGHFVTAMPNPRTIHDFYGFPDDLYRVEYPVKGSPETAEYISELVREIQLDHEWGLDHGAWSVLMHLIPDCRTPILQLSIDMATSPQEEYNLARRLRALRDKGVLFIGSGNIVHNLRTLRFEGGDAYDWALEFDTASRSLIEAGDHDSLIHYENLGQAAQLSIPTDDHYRPMLSALALSYPDERPVFFNETIDLGSIGMRSFVMASDPVR